MPNLGGIDTAGLDIDSETMASLRNVDNKQWQEELKTIGEYFDEYGDRLPAELRAQQEKAVSDLN